MARFDVFRNPGNEQTPFLLDVQCDLLSGLESRIVIPLRRIDAFSAVALPKNLAPTFEIDGVRCFLETPKMAAVPSRILRSSAGTLAQHQAEITGALDFLFYGF